MTRYDTTTIHRYLDGVFEGLPLTPEVQDLKEEIRGNLTARVTELEAGGLDATAASRKAIKELGDVREIIAQLGVEKGATPPRAAAVAAYNRNKVRPRPGFVVRTVGLSLAAAFGAVAYVLSIVGVGDSEWYLEAGSVAIVLALPIGLLVADSLRQETTANHPLPAWRAAGYGLATAMCVGGLVLIGLYIARSSLDWVVMTGVPLVVVAIVLYSYLGATQTNRKKAWARETAEGWPDPVQARIDNNPVVAARFGIYSGALWISAIGAFIVMSIQFGFGFSWVAFLLALIAQMLLIARTLFADDGKKGDN
jgi:hypothetical protein